jgi:hypothetical protein
MQEFYTRARRYYSKITAGSGLGDRSEADNLFRKSLAEGSVPADWRKANVTPIFKKGSKSDLGNYRPVSLTSICGKLMEDT